MEIFNLVPSFRKKLVQEAQEIFGNDSLNGKPYYRTRIFGFKSSHEEAKHMWPTPDKNHRVADKEHLIDKTKYPTFAKLTSALPGLSFMHLLVIQGDKENAQHMREHIERAVYSRDNGPRGSYYVGARFHIALSGSTEHVWMAMDKDVYGVKDGTFFFYCHGCAHISGNANPDPSALPRINLVFDMYLSRRPSTFYSWTIPRRYVCARRPRGGHHAHRAPSWAGARLEMAPPRRACRGSASTPSRILPFERKRCSSRPSLTPSTQKRLNSTTPPQAPQTSTPGLKGTTKIFGDHFLFSYHL